METTGSGAGIMLALAAVLWLVYLVPSWFRRREYLATERNAVRLQQSLRILAETAEVPEVVRTESTARSVAAQERAIRELGKRRKLEEKRLAAEARSRSAAAARSTRGTSIAEPVSTPVAPPTARTARPAARSGPSVRAARLRRTRLLATGTLLLGVASMFSLGGVIATSGASTLVSAGIAGSGALTVLALAALNRVAAVARGSVASAADLRPARAEVRDFAFEPEARAWTPVPLPKPLYMSKPVVAPPVMADPREDERKAAAVQAGEVTPIAQPIRAAGTGTVAQELAPAAPPSKFAAMGRVDLGGSSAPDLEAVLRRRLNRAG